MSRTTDLCVREIAAFDNVITITTPNKGQITRMQVRRRHGEDWRLLVFTRSRVYYLRRNKLRLRRKL